MHRRRRASKTSSRRHSRSRGSGRTSGRRTQTAPEITSACNPSYAPGQLVVASGDNFGRQRDHGHSAHISWVAREHVPFLLECMHGFAGAGAGARASGTAWSASWFRAAPSPSRRTQTDAHDAAQLPHVRAKCAELGHCRRIASTCACNIPDEGRRRGYRAPRRAEVIVDERVSTAS